MLKRSTERRATILLMVVGLLAMLFVIVTAFLSLARFDRLALRESEARQVLDSAVVSVNELIASQLAGTLLGADGVAGSNATPVKGLMTEDIPHSSPIAALEPVRDGAADRSPAAVGQVGSAFEDVLNLRWPTVTSLERETPAFAPRLIDLVIDFNEDGFKQNPIGQPAFNDLWGYNRRPLNDADGDGIPDSSFVLARIATQMVNAIGGRAISLPPVTFGPQNVVLNNRRSVWQPLFSSGAIGAAGVSTWRDNAEIADLPDASDPSVLAWRDFDRSARSIVSVRVVSEGAKVSLLSPGRYGDARNPTAFGREFAVGMFSFLRHPEDRGRLALNDDVLFSGIAANAPALQAVLSRRGGILASESQVAQGAPQRDTARVPAFLRELEQRFPYTFVTRFQPSRGAQTLKGEFWQRFSLITNSARNPQADELQAFSGSAKLAPLESARLYGQPFRNGEDADHMLDRRHLLTTYSHSDELARHLGARSASRLGMEAIGASPMGLAPGRTKFYLGRIADPRPFPNRLRPQGVGQDDPRGAFNANGTFNPITGGRVIREIADYYFEMLYSHSGWKMPDVTQPVAAMRRQAFMLAVNTVAFAAPRRAANVGGAPVGRIDPVYYVDSVGGGLDVVVGYQPQPYITQLTVVGEKRRVGSGGGPGPTLGSAEDLAIAVELYNPNDPTAISADPFDVTVDQHALALDDYAISIGDPNANGPADPNVVLPVAANTGIDPTAARRLDDNVFQAPDSLPVLPGRSFKVVLIRNGLRPSYFVNNITQIPDGAGNPAAVGQINDMTIPFGVTDNQIRVNLWRRVPNFRFPPNNGLTQTPVILPERWVLVDQMRVAVPSFRPGPDEDTENETYWYVNAARNMTSTRAFGDYGDPTREARWRMVTAFEPDDTNYYNASEEVDLGSVPLSLASQLGSPNGPSTPAAPFVPLHTMNANRTSIAGGDGHTQAPVHGMRRPASFPTVGFLHFVPRYAHLQRIIDASLTTGTHYTVGRTLRGHFDPNSRQYEFASVGEVPADFGHMRLLDNREDNRREVPRPNGYFTRDFAGILPWGQLVYDYFTVFNAADPNNDAFGGSDGAELSDAVDPMRVPGRININTAPWHVLAAVPVIGPKTAAQVEGGYAAGQANMPETWIDRSASAAFWSARAGVLVGRSAPSYLDVVPPYSPADPPFRSIRPARWNIASNIPGIVDTSTIDGVSASYPPQPGASLNPAVVSWYRLGGDLAVALAGYRDRLAYVPPSDGLRPQRPLDGWWDSYRRGKDGAVAAPFDPDPANPATQQSMVVNATSAGNYRGGRYGDVRHKGTHNPPGGTGQVDIPAFGFLTLGELLNVKGMDGALYQHGNAQSEYLGVAGDHDFYRAVAFMALLDTQWLTTRSNVFTVYMSIADREDPQASVRSQITLDRSNVLPRAVRGALGVSSTGQFVYADIDGDGLTTDLDREWVTVPGDLKPQVVAERRGGYFSARFDD
ncbi:MAG: hypothetical protein HRU75_13360 [Planctomycetia bacterium]|nr:MAG: hypothetical protein HRU75_13360 [Planctomycetia bacterium]